MINFEAWLENPEPEEPTPLAPEPEEVEPVPEPEPAPAFPDPEDLPPAPDTTVPDDYVVCDKWTAGDLRFLLEKTEEGQRPLFVADSGRSGLPTIQVVHGYTTHCGMGVFKTRGPGYELMFEAGSMMPHVPGGTGYTFLTGDGLDKWITESGYDLDHVLSTIRGHLRNAQNEYDQGYKPVEAPVFERNAEVRPKFSLGRIVQTSGARYAFQETGENPVDYLYRHQIGDWGDLGHPEDAKANEKALDHSDPQRILSKYALKNGDTIYIITEWNRSSTCIMLTGEY